MKKLTKPLIISIIFISAICLILVLYKNSINQTYKKHKVIQVVAAENFWGNLVSQIGGNKVNVVSIVSDPNADPHEYESSTINARYFSNSDYVVLNGAGYDSWANKLLSANVNNDRKVLTISDFLNKDSRDNPHFWYNPNYVNTIVKQFELNLSKIDPVDSKYFQLNLYNVQKSLDTYQQNINNIKTKYSGVKVSATENIFTYLAEAAGLNLVSPQNFMQAISEGNDPPTSSVVDFQNQLKSGQVKLLVYNLQTITPLTNNMKQLANQQKIQSVGVSETLQPKSTTFQDWMNKQVLSIGDALDNTGVNQ